MSFIINPGTGPVEDATLADAEANVARLVEDAGRPFVFSHTGREYNGRFTFALTLGSERREVDMPGLPLERVRFVNGAEQNIFDYPRLYVDGSSWVWCYAAGILAEPPEGDDE